MSPDYDELTSLRSRVAELEARQREMRAEIEYERGHRHLDGLTYSKLRSWCRKAMGALERTYRVQTRFSHFEEDECSNELRTVLSEGREMGI